MCRISSNKASTSTNSTRRAKTLAAVNCLTLGRHPQSEQNETVPKSRDCVYPPYGRANSNTEC
jgi:hypothetical protein